MHGLAVIHQRRHCLSMVIWRRDAFVTYLLHFRTWDVANPRTTMPFPNNLLSNFSICTVFAICQLTSSSTGHGDGTFSIFLGSLHRPIPVRCNWSVFARKMHSTSEFAKIVLSKCVIHAGFVTVAWTLRGITFQVGEWILDLTSEFTVFNLVIRRSKVKQLTIFRVSPVACRFVKQWAAVLGFTFFSRSFDKISEFSVSI